MSSDPDRDDMLAFQKNGDRAPLEALWRRHADEAWRLARWVCGDRAEDALQEAALQLVRAAPRWHDGEPGSTAHWLMTIVTNAARKERRRGRSRWLPLGVVGELPAPSAAVQDEERQERVRKSLDRLASRYRQPVELRYLAGLEFPAVAAALGVPERTARTRVSRGLAQMRELLGVPSTAGTAGVVILLTPDALPVAPHAIRDLVSQVPAGAQAAVAVGHGALALKGTLAVLLVAGSVGAWQVVMLRNKPPRPRPVAITLDPVPITEPAVEVSIIPRGWSAMEAFADLRRKGGPRVVVMGWDHVQLDLWLVIPADKRFKPVTGGKLIEAVAAARGWKIAWKHAGNVAIMYPGASPVAIHSVRQEAISTDPVVRKHAIERCGGLMDPEVAVLLFQMARDTDADVVRQAVRSLRRLGWEAALAIDPTGVDLLADELSSQNPSVRMEALRGLGPIGGGAALALLERALADQDSRVRRDVIEVLGDMGGNQAVGLLRKALNDQDGTVRRASVKALYLAGDDWARALSGKAFAGPDLQVRYGLIDALGRVDGESDKALEIINQALKDTDPGIRWIAASALGRVGGAQAQKLIETSLASLDVKIRSGAALALGSVGGESAVALLEIALNDKDSEVRGGAATALASVSSDRALELLGQAIIHQDADVRRITVYALSHVGDARALALLEVASTDPNNVVRWSVAETLGHVGGDTARAVTLLSKSFTDPHPNVRSVAVLALGHVGGDQAVNLLAKALTGSDAALRSSAVHALGGIGGEKSRDVLIRQLATERDDSIRRAIADELRVHSLDDPMSNKAVGAAESRLPKPEPAAQGPSPATGKSNDF